MRTLLLAATILFGACEGVRAFCGFYVAQSGENLVNHASKVVLAHQGDRTAITMSSDVSGNPRDFALVIPVPTTIQRDQVRLVQSQTVDHLDSFSVPRLVEYYDPDPCPPPYDSRYRYLAVPAPMAAPPSVARAANAQGVTVEASYSVGEYDILVLSALNSGGLLSWLNDNGYKVPAAAEPTIRSYLGQRMQFFVAKVNLARQERSGSPFLRPIQVEYRSPKFMLPIRLGTVNAEGQQEMVVLALTERGRVETTNYRTVRMPTGTEVPLFVQQDFARFYKAAFDRQVHDADGQAVFLEYAWDMANCDPCSAEPLSRDELRELGAAWTEGGRGRAPGTPGAPLPPGRGGFGGEGAFVTRLHLRYDRAHFPEDLALQETGDRETYQARYVLQKPWTGAAACDAGKRYLASLPARAQRQARNVLEITDWSYDDVRQRMEAAGQRLP